MAGLVPAIHVFAPEERKAWMPGSSPGMTESYSVDGFTGQSRLA
jgi:hypothetical protein